MSEVSTIGLDLAKTVFQVHGAGQDGAALVRKKLRRDQVLPFFSTQPSLRGSDGGMRERALLGTGDQQVRP